MLLPSLPASTVKLSRDSKKVSGRILFTTSVRIYWHFRWLCCRPVCFGSSSSFRYERGEARGNPPRLEQVRDPHTSHIKPAVSPWSFGGLLLFEFEKTKNLSPRLKFVRISVNPNPPKKNLKLSAVRLRCLSEFSRGEFLADAGGENGSRYFKNRAIIKFGKKMRVVELDGFYVRILARPLPSSFKRSA